MLPNIATWWCGQAAERAHVRANMDRMMIGPALSTRLPFEVDEATVLGGRFRGQARASFDAWLEADGAGLVGQEAVTLSTTPAYVDGVLVPRPMSLRVFLARTAAGLGGDAAAASPASATPPTPPRSPCSAAAPPPTSGWSATARSRPSPCCRTTADALRARPPGVLPSRAGDNLFWLGRYVERAEGTMRLLRAYHVRLAETADPEAPLLANFADYLEALGIDSAGGDPGAR